MNRPAIRHATEADIERIRRLQVRWQDEATVIGFVPGAEEEIRAALGPYALVAELGGEIVGFILGSIRVAQDMGAVIPDGAEYLEIDDLYVAPGLRGNNIGSLLVEELLRTAKQAGIHWSLVYSASKDIHGILRFYERHGFRSWFVQMVQELSLP